MDRREFLVASGGGLGLLCTSSLTGCRATGEGDGFDPGPYRVGDDPLVLDGRGELVRVDPSARALVEADGDVLVRASGEQPGDAAGHWNLPADAAVDGKGRVLVLDHGNSHVHVYEKNGSYAGAISGHGSGPSDLNHPQDLHVEGGRIYVCDTLNHRVQVFDAEGRAILCCRGAEGDALNAPRGLALASNGELHVVDSGNARVVVFDEAGKALRSYGGYGTEPGHMLSPRAISPMPGGRMAVADPVGGWVSVFGESGAFAGRFRPMDDQGRTAVPVGLTALPDGSLYVYAAGLRAFEPAVG